VVLEFADHACGSGMGTGRVRCKKGNEYELSVQAVVLGQTIIRNEFIWGNFRNAKGLDKILQPRESPSAPACLIPGAPG